MQPADALVRHLRAALASHRLVVAERDPAQPRLALREEIRLAHGCLFYAMCVNRIRLMAIRSHVFNGSRRDVVDGRVSTLRDLATFSMTIPAGGERPEPARPTPEGARTQEVPR